MSELTLPFDAVAERRMSEASLEAWQRLLPHVAALDFETLDLIYSYLASTGFSDVTGAELAAWSGRDKTSTRPSMTRLFQKSLLQHGPKRQSRAGEVSCRPLQPTVSQAAVLRAKRLQRSE